MLSGLEVVVVPMSDVDRAKAFHADLVGLVVDVECLGRPGESDDA